MKLERSGAAQSLNGSDDGDELSRQEAPGVNPWATMALVNVSPTCRLCRLPFEIPFVRRSRAGQTTSALSIFDVSMYFWSGQFTRGRGGSELFIAS